MSIESTPFQGMSGLGGDISTDVYSYSAPISAFSKQFGGKMLIPAPEMYSGQARGFAAIQAAIDAMLTDVLNDYIDQMSEWIDMNIPFRTGALHDAVRNLIAQSTKGVLLLGGAGVTYAGYVNAMNPPIHWTYPGSVYHWFEKALQYRDQILPRIVRKAIQDEQLSLLTGMSSRALAGEVID